MERAPAAKSWVQDESPGAANALMMAASGWSPGLLLLRDDPASSDSARPQRALSLLPLRVNMAADPAFASVKLVPGLLVWRIEDFKVVAVPEAHYGRFFQGDSYIVYAATKKNGVVDAHVHFWLGSETSQDEAGAAAIKAVELDDALGGVPTQHREVEGHESELFLSHFRVTGGIEYLRGGVASGFAHVEPETYEPRLLHIKGRRSTRATQVPVTVSSLNDGDVFILDLGMKLYMWSGAGANKYEKAKAVEVMARIDDVRGGKPERFIVNDDDAAAAEFWAAVGGSVDDVAHASAGGDDEEATTGAGSTRIFRVSNASGALEVAEIPIGEDGRVRRELLDPADVFIVDAGNSVFAWVGKGASDAEKHAALPTAQEFIRTQGKPSWVSATVVRQNLEPVEFKSLFYHWEAPRVFDFSTRASVGVAPREVESIDYEALAKGSPDSEDLPGLTDAGTVTVYRVTGTERVEVDDAHKGQFFAEDSYVVHAAFHAAGPASSHMLYYWLGRGSAQTERGAAALHAIELGKAISGGRTAQVRVCQGAEPLHFCALFKGELIIHTAESTTSDAVCLYHVKGTRPGTTKAVQVLAIASNLNSGDCFVAVAPGSDTLVWRGAGSSIEERAVASRVAHRLARGGVVREVDEGGESEAFWRLLGGRAAYPTQVPPPNPPSAPRLFHITDMTGSMRVREIPNFTQEDLLTDDVMLLDTFNQVFIWIGDGASEVERVRASQVASSYLEAASDGRPSSVPIIVQYQGSEVPFFTCNFHAWSSDRAASSSKSDPYEERLSRLRQEQAARKAAEEARSASMSDRLAAAVAVHEPSMAMTSAAASGSERLALPTILPGSRTFRLADLQAIRDRSEADIDLSAKEQYLTDDDFTAALGVSRAEFAAMAKWRQRKLKIDAGIF